jgi:hypothetical protein
MVSPKKVYKFKNVIKIWSISKSFFKCYNRLLFCDALTAMGAEDDDDDDPDAASDPICQVDLQVSLNVNSM